MNRQKEEKHIVYITDENYAMPTAVSILSLIRNHTSAVRYHVHVLGNGLSQWTKEMIEALGDESAVCSVMEIPQGKYKKLAESCLTEGIHVTDTALYKFDIANILEFADQVLYLDSDILVTGDISELFDLELSDHYLAAVDEMGDEKNPDGTSTLASRIGLERVSYFNSGVMILNLDGLRREGVRDRLLEYRIKKPNYFMDQDAFNGVMHDRRMKLPCRYNFRAPLFDVMLPSEIGERFYSVRYETVQECLSDQKIIHMSSQFKPWRYNIPWITELFLTYYRRSPYGDKELQLLSPLKGLYDIYYPWKIEGQKFEALSLKYRKTFDERNRKIWGFPYAQIERGSRVVLYGAGDVGKDCKMQIDASGYCNLVLWTDRNYRQLGGQVKPPEEIACMDFDYVLVAIAEADTVKRVTDYLRKLHVAEEKIVAV